MVFTEGATVIMFIIFSFLNIMTRLKTHEHEVSKCLT